MPRAFAAGDTAPSLRTGFLRNVAGTPLRWLRDDGRDRCAERVELRSFVFVQVEEAPDFAGDINLRYERFGLFGRHLQQDNPSTGHLYRPFSWENRAYQYLWSRFQQQS